MVANTWKRALMLAALGLIQAGVGVLCAYGYPIHHDGQRCRPSGVDCPLKGTTQFAYYCTNANQGLFCSDSPPDGCDEYAPDPCGNEFDVFYDTPILDGNNQPVPCPQSIGVCT
jgi:hypothetical protein